MDPDVVAAGQGGSDDERRLGYATELLSQRVGEGRPSLAQLWGALSSLYVLAPGLGEGRPMSSQAGTCGSAGPGAWPEARRMVPGLEGAAAPLLG